MSNTTNNLLLKRNFNDFSPLIYKTNLYFDLFDEINTFFNISISSRTLPAPIATQSRGLDET
jgi:hypothetical protein